MGNDEKGAPRIIGDRDARIRQAVILRKRGESLTRIAAQIGVHFSTISTWLKASGYRSGAEPQHKKENEEKFRKAIVFQKQGLSQTHIAKKLGVSWTTAHKWVLEAKSVKPVRKRRGKVEGNGILVIRIDEKGGTFGHGGRLCRVQCERLSNLGKFARGFLEGENS